MVTRYQKRISGPPLDRIDIHIEVPRVEYEKLADYRIGEPVSAEGEQGRRGTVAHTGLLVADACPIGDCAWSAYEVTEDGPPQGSGKGSRVQIVHIGRAPETPETRLMSAMAMCNAARRASIETGPPLPLPKMRIRQYFFALRRLPSAPSRSAFQRETRCEGERQV